MKLTKKVEVEVEKTIEFEFTFGLGEIFVKFPSRKKAEAALDSFFNEFCLWAKNFELHHIWVVWPGSHKSDDNKGFCCLASFAEDAQTKER